jgi:hypothetical protein
VVLRCHEVEGVSPFSPHAGGVARGENEGESALGRFVQWSGVGKRSGADEEKGHCSPDPCLQTSVAWETRDSWIYARLNVATPAIFSQVRAFEFLTFDDLSAQWVLVSVARPGSTLRL